MLPWGRPGCLAVPPRLRALRGRSDHRPLKDSRTKSLVRFDDSSQHPRLVGGGRAQGTDDANEKPWSDERRKARPFSPSFCLRSSPAHGRPAFLLAQMRHWRFGEGVERAPAGLAAEPRQSARAPHSLGPPPAHGRSPPTRPDGGCAWHQSVPSPWLADRLPARSHPTSKAPQPHPAAASR